MEDEKVDSSSDIDGTRAQSASRGECANDIKYITRLYIGVIPVIVKMHMNPFIAGLYSA